MTKKKKQVLFVVLFCIAAAIFSLLRHHNNDAAQTLTQEANIQGEFQKIAPLPESTQVSTNTVRKDGLVSVSQRYASTQPYSAIRSYFLMKLPEAGWIFSEEKPLSDWGKPTQSLQLLFKKEPYLLTITHQADSSVFDISIRWSLWTVQ